MEKFRKKAIILGCSVTIMIGAIFLYYSTDKRERLTYDKNNTIAIYLEDTTSSDGYKLSNSKVFPKKGYVLNTSKSKCTNGGVLTQNEVTKAINLQVKSNESCFLFFDRIKIKIGETVLTVKENLPDFSQCANTDETVDGLYSLIDDSGKSSYFFRGAATNNYVQFGKNTAGELMYWRIIRFNGDGSMRMQYDGTGPANDSSYTYTRGFALTNQVWNTKYNDAKYVGWMFGGAQGTASTSKEQAQKNETSSEIKIAVDNWYKTNILDTGYHDYVADEVFCNDRSTPGKDVTNYSADTALGYSQNTTIYGASVRVGLHSNSTEVKPDFVCPQNNDKFTVNTSSGGNGALRYPVGLITADEVLAAGSGKYNVSSAYYLNKNASYWIFTPFNYVGGADVDRVGNLGQQSGNFTLGKESVSPVINLKAEYVSLLVGDGTSGNPYHLSGK